MEGAPRLQQLGKSPAPQTSLCHPQEFLCPRNSQGKGLGRILLWEREGQVFQLTLFREQLLQLCPRVCTEVDF